MDILFKTCVQVKREDDSKLKILKGHPNPRIREAKSRLFSNYFLFAILFYIRKPKLRELVSWIFCCSTQNIALKIFERGVSSVSFRQIFIPNR